MLDIQLIRNEPDRMRKALASRGYDAKALDEILKLDEKWRKLRGEADELNAQRNRISIEIGELKKAGKDAKAKIKDVGKKTAEINGANAKADEVRAKIDALLLTLPNLPHARVPL